MLQHSHASENAAICTAVSKNYYKTRNFRVLFISQP